ncbi:hypothetical protein FO454_08315 [Staphylococcus lugdunensis]|uniref:Uncharacterized protein n=1 Tax=Staphylococcus lugdunensis TaxID=28035 RepID=A0ABX6BVN5_STALU|nr:hypothetical protein FO459_03295 [Staphylococcus lugdunensis]QEX31282.1 hypothetical protein FO457_06315 [Staphylococcus lugdunensis]QEX35479.1 hypothetical protein FO455_03080 [Staphylococcus lugdunensis]QEX38884.1 hypothetical protein FO454_08315 [Staphylococcus lugdunensis]
MERAYYKRIFNPVNYCQYIFLYGYIFEGTFFRRIALVIYLSYLGITKCCPLEMLLLVKPFAAFILLTFSGEPLP